MLEWNPEFREESALRVAGPAGEYTMEQLAEIPQQWNRFGAELTGLGLVAGPYFGVILGDQGRPMRYITAIPAEQVKEQQAGWETVEVPAQFYAIFGGDGGAKVIQEMWAGIWREWLGNSGRTVTGGPMVEFYPPGYGQGEHLKFEIWIPVEQ